MLVAIAACNSAPTLSVVVQHPDGLVVATTEVTVYESQTLTCTDVEFGLLNASELQPLITADEMLESGGATTGDLDGISRTNNKVIVARGFDASGTLIAAGCVQQGVVSANTTVTIDTVVAATVAIDPPDGSDMTATMISATDPSGALIDGRAISWTVYGPASSMPASTTYATVTSDGVWQATSPTCTAQGIAQVHVVPPSTVGGYAVQMRVAWSTEPAPLFTNLSTSEFGGQALAGAPSGVSKACAIRHAGTTQRLVCVDSTNTATDYAVTVSNGVASLQAMGTQSAPASTVALISVPNGNDLGVYAVDNNGSLTALFGAPAATNTGSRCLSNCTDAIVLPACDSITGKIVVRAPTELHLLDYSGNFLKLASAPFAQLDNAGCVTDLDATGTPSLVQAFSAIAHVTTAGATTTNVALFACTNTDCVQVGSGVDASLERGASLGFTGGAEPRLVVPSFDATGVVLLQLVLTSTTGVIERARMPAASLPLQIVGGQFDGDGSPDLLWDVQTPKGTSFEVAYARQVDNEPLEALTQATSASVDDILSGDLTGDGLDDVVVVAASTLVTGVAVVPMSAPVQTTVTADPTCSP